MKNDNTLRDHLTASLENSHAHLEFVDAIGGFPFEMNGRVVEPVPNSAWQLVYHLWIVQNDLLEYIRDAKHVSPEYPSGYWPEGLEAPDKKAWDSAIGKFNSDLNAFKDMVEHPDTDLLAPMAHTPGHTILREVLILIRHNSYHVAQLVDLRMLLGIPVKDW